jgi:hypothetical protein
MHRTDYACLMLRLLGYSATENLQRDLASGQTRWQITARNESGVIVVRAPTQSAAWAEACRMSERLLCED